MLPIKHLALAGWVGAPNARDQRQAAPAARLERTAAACQMDALSAPKESKFDFVIVAAHRRLESPRPTSVAAGRHVRLASLMMSLTPPWAASRRLALISAVRRRPV
jgi:hypothetical protein